MTHNTTGPGKDRIIKILKILVFAALLAASAVYCIKLVERKQSMEKNGAFFELAKKDQIDGLFVGSSHVINGIDPAQIYEEQGFTAFDLAGHGNTLPVSYWVLVNALDYCTPKYVFIDTYMIEKDYKYLDVPDENDGHDTKTAVDQLHEALDCFPLTKNKIAAINDLIEDKSVRSEFVLPFIKYHSRFNELTRDDYLAASGDGNINMRLGSQLRYEVSDPVSTYGLLGADDMTQLDTYGSRYLEKMVELCLSKGITPVMIQVPFEESEEYQRAANYAADISERYNVPFVNMRYVENIINNYSDLQSQTHLSAYGAYKVTNYFASNVLTALEMTDHRGDSNYSSWQEYVDARHEEIKAAAQDPVDIYSALMILQFDDVSSIIFVNNDSNALRDEMIVKELSDLAGKAPGIENARSITGPYVVIHDSKNNVYEDDLDEGNSDGSVVPFDEGIETSFGKVRFLMPADNYNVMFLGDDQENNILEYDENYDVDIQIFIFDNNDGSMLSHLCFKDGGIVR